MILLGLGSNMAGIWGSSEATLSAAIAQLQAQNIALVAQSAWLRTSAYGVENQPDFVNGVIAVTTHRPPESLLAICQQIEKSAGRARARVWGPRVLDIDLLAYHNVILRYSVDRNPPDTAPQPGPRPLVLPHPGIARRAFVLEPLCDIAPLWHHPVSGKTAAQMLRDLRGAAGGRVIAPAR